MTKYTLIKNETGDIVKRENDDETITYIPTDPSNSDYQRYLRWLENPEADEAQSL